jgi:hypothetical protein
MNGLSPARRVRRAFLRLGLLTAITAFCLIGGLVLFDQWAEGYASGVFMLGTALLIIGGCIGLFSIILAIGLLISIAFNDAPPPQDL